MTDFNLERVIAKSITVRRSIDTAFQIWTEKLDLWWPKDHLVNKDPRTQILLEGQVGGRFYERTADGTEYEWGLVTIWEPPHRLAYTWNRGSSVERPTRVEIQFTALAQDRTRVALGAFLQAIDEIKGDGTFTFSKQAASFDTLNSIF